MSVKPSIVCIKGVHSTTGTDQTSDIEFPQLELEKLFEGATIKQIDSNANYNSAKKYVYKDQLGKYQAIEGDAHFNCIKNGYQALADGTVDHYYTREGSDYVYHAVPATDTWAEKHTFSNTLSNGTVLYSINGEDKNRVCIDGSYYNKNGNDFVKQNPETYTLYETVDVSWQDQDKYICKSKPIFDEGDNIIGTKNIWQNSKKTLAESGYYITVLKQNGLDAGDDSEVRYIIQLQYMSFTDGVWDYDSNASALEIYKFNYDSIDNLYMKNGDHLDDPSSKSVFTSDPTATIEYFYHEMDTWQYPNTLSPSTTPDLMKGPNGNLLSYSAADYPLYEEATVTTINKIQNTSYTIYEKTAVKINYMYKNNSNSLKFIFTDKDIPGVLEACGLDSSLERYVHLTNLEYNSN